MKAIVIYYDEDKRRKQVIRPSDEFWKKPDVRGLVEHITHSDLLLNRKNYYSFEII